MTLVIFSAPPLLKSRLQALFGTNLTHILQDPFALYIICIEELWRQAQGVYGRVRDIFGGIEKVCCHHIQYRRVLSEIQDTLDAAAATSAGSQDVQYDFAGLHNVAKHIMCAQAFNMVTQRDSHAMIEDSKSMRAIATVTVFFLPLATVAV